MLEEDRIQSILNFVEMKENKCSEMSKALESDVGSNSYLINQAEEMAYANVRCYIQDLIMGKIQGV